MPPSTVNAATQKRSLSGEGEIAVATIIPLVFAAVVLLGRCYSRTFLIRNWGWDDSFIVFAWLTSVFIQVDGCIANVLFQENVAAARIVHYVTAMAYQVALFSTKLSICCSYLRIIASSTYRKLTWATIAFVICSLTPLLIARVFACDNDTGLSFFNPSTKCVSCTAILYTSSALQISTDIWLIAFIVPFIIKLNVPRRQRGALILVLSGGILVIAANIARAIVNSDLKHFDLFTFALWSSIEVNVGIMCASIPATLPLLRKIAPGAMTWLTSQGPHVQRRNGITKQLSRIRRGEDALEMSNEESGVRSNSTAQGSIVTASSEKPTEIREWTDRSTQEKALGGKSEMVVILTARDKEEPREHHAGDHDQYERQ